MEKLQGVGRTEVLGDVVELVAVLDKVTSVVAWAAVAAECVVVVNTAKDTSWLLCKSDQIGVCKYVNQSIPLTCKKNIIQYNTVMWRSERLTVDNQSLLEKLIC